MIWTYYFKKTSNNRRRILTLTAGMIITLALYVGITMYVTNITSSLSDTIETRDEIDYVIDTGMIDPINASIDIQRLITAKNINTVDTMVPIYKWQITAVDWNWYVDAMGIWTRTPSYYGHSPVPCVSVTKSFANVFASMIIMRNGTFDVSTFIASDNRTIHNVVVTESFLTREDLDLSLSQRKVGGEFFTWNWMYVKDPTNKADKAINEIKYCRIAGIIDSDSKIFELSLMSNLIYGNGIFCSPDLHPQFFRDIVFQIAESGMARMFTFHNLAKFQLKTFISYKLQPGNLLKMITTDLDSMYAYLNANNNETTYDLYRDNNYNPEFPDSSAYQEIDIGEIQSLIKEYLYWYEAALPKFLIFSSPVFFIGIYILNFSVRHTMKERSKELSNLKSRGVSNLQIVSLILVEITVVTLYSTIFGLLLGIVLSNLFSTDLANIDFLSILTENIVLQFLIVYTIGWLLLLTLSFIPILRIINLDIDILAREGEPEGLEITETDITSYNGKLFAIGILCIVGLPTLGLSAMSTPFLLTLGIIAFILFLISGLALLAQIARLIPSIVDKFTQGRIPQLYLLSREMRRLSKRSSAAFVVLSLTVTFGIISSGIISTSTSYYTNNANFEAGSDYNLAISSSVWTAASIYENTYSNLLNKSLFPEISSASPVFPTSGYLIEEDEEFPYEHSTAFTYFHQYFYVLFIDASTYLQTAYYEDYFISSPTSMKFTELMHQMAIDPLHSCIIDASTAREHNILANQSIKVSVGPPQSSSVFTSSLNILKTTTRVLGTMNYFAPNLTAGVIPFIIFDYKIINNGTQFNTPNPVSNILVKLSQQYKNEFFANWGYKFSDKLEKYRLIYVSGYSQDNSQCVQIRMSNDDITGRDFTTLINLLLVDYYYALFISVVGFFLVLEIKTEERREEIGILKAIGFGHRETFLLIMTEGIIAVIMAAISGFLIGVLCVNLMNFLFIPDLILPKIYTFAVDLLLNQTFIGIIGTIIGVLIPAYLTKRYKISDLIKHE